MMRKQVEEAIQTRKSEIHKHGKTDLWISGVNKWRYGVEVDGILSSYHNLRKLKDSHASSVNEETKSREISKMEIFNKSKNEKQFTKVQWLWIRVGYAYVSKRRFENPSINYTKRINTLKVTCLCNQHHHLSGVLLILTKYGRDYKGHLEMQNFRQIWHLI